MSSLTSNWRPCWTHSACNKGSGWAPSICRTWRACHPTLTCVWRQTNEPAPTPTAPDIHMNDAGNHHQAQVRSFPFLSCHSHPHSTKTSHSIPVPNILTPPLPILLLYSESRSGRSPTLRPPQVPPTGRIRQLPARSWRPSRTPTTQTH
jgi:hypothetical protein